MAQSDEGRDDWLSTFIAHPAVEAIALKGLFGEELTSSELYDLCVAVLREIERRRRGLSTDDPF